MKSLERIGVSLEKELLSDFDKLIKKQGYQSRSEALRDLIRHQLSEQTIENPKTRAIAAIVLVYDHHAAKVMQKLTALQHNHLLETISSMHVHMDSHDCMEIIVLKGTVGDIKKMGEEIVSIKGVKLGKVNLVESHSTHSH
ncbi:MAG: nickel-responsive transcriptional regulator NikR [Planctomycetes bacterium]|nr:nickel-responsive transcriptional regulator NikR [Planctomycetota bacterium]